MVGSTFSFKVLAKEKNARAGVINTKRGKIDTPAFMPVGTQATVKSVFVDDIISIGFQIILSNTYHLMLRPGTDRIKLFGGVHKFMNCPLPILTDSGGFQIMSLAKLMNVDIEQGAIFRSHLDGKKIILSPEKSIQVQKDLDSDILMVLDQCPALTKDKKKIKKALDTSEYWAQRSKTEFGKNKNKALFGIVQGGIFEDLRIESLKKTLKIDFDGYALGGLAVGETQKQMFEVLDNITHHMPEDKPRYLMGVGTPSDILGAVKRGVDMFDCVIPTRSGRTGLVFTWKGKLNLRNSKYKNDTTPIDENPDFRNLNLYSKSYLNHLINSNEILASMILTLHNLKFYWELMSAIRNSIKNGQFDQFFNKYIDLL